MKARGPFSTSNYHRSLVTPVTAAPWALSAWLYPVDGSSGTFFLFGDTAAAVDYFSCYVVVGTSARLYARRDATSVFAAQTGLSIGAWNHVVWLTLAANHRIVYVNGSPGSAETTSCTPAGIDAMSLGVKLIDSVSLPFNGYAANVGLYATLTPDQITRLAGGAGVATVARDNLLAGWRGMAPDGDEPDILGAYDLTEVGTVPSQDGPPIRRAQTLAEHAGQLCAAAPAGWR